MSGREPTDFFAVLPQHLKIHDRLENWRRYVEDRGRGTAVHPMFKGYRHERHREFVVHIPIDTIDGHKMEIAVSQLPEKNRDAIRWVYVYHWIRPEKAGRVLGVNRSGLVELIHSGRSILNNRSKHCD